jgi:hypothetical protein
VISSEKIASRASKYDDFLIFIFLPPCLSQKTYADVNSDAP